MEAIVIVRQSLFKRLRPQSTASFLLGFSMFMTGACGLVSEYVLSTVSTYILGNSIEQFSVVIALMMFMMGLASYFQKYVSDEGLLEKFIIVEILLAILCGFAPTAMCASFGLMETHFLLVQYFFVMSIGFLIGFEAPLVLRINRKYAKNLGTNLSQVFSADYVGAFVGALVWAYYLLKTYPIQEISFILAGCNFLVAIVTFLYFFRKGLVKRKVLCSFLIVIAAAGLVYGYTHNQGWNANLEQRLYEDKIVLSKTTKYQRIVLTYNSQIKEHRLYINGNLQFSSLDENIYHEQLVHPVMSLVSSHRNVLILGGGDGMALREVLKYPDVESVTLVDLDEQMTELFSTDPLLSELNHHSFGDARVKVLKTQALEDMEVWKPIYQETGKKDKEGQEGVNAVASVCVYNLDADRFLQEIRGRWDVVIIDFPDPNSVELSKLYSKEFFLKLRRNLAEGGLIVMQATSPYHAKEAYLCIRRTMEAGGFTTLPYHDNVPSFGDWGWILAWKNQINSGLIEAKIASMNSFPIQTSYLTPDVFRRARIFGKGWLECEDARVSTLMYPIIFEKYVHASWLVE